jgi:hypothetical protein
METRCQKCDTPAASDQAFCTKCGAVLGMTDDAGEDAPELEATLVGEKYPTTASGRRPVTRPPTPSPLAETPPAPTTPPPPAPAPAARGGALVFVAVGIFLVLALLLFFLIGRG